LWCFAQRGDGVEVRLAGRRPLRPAGQHDDHHRPPGWRRIQQSGGAGNFSGDQALLGIGLGIAISRQQHLAQNLHHYRQRLETELAARRALTEKLIHTEEDTRKSLARELHDEIGQNITAIQIQSQLVKRARDPAQTRPPPARLTISPGVFTTPPASCCASCAPGARRTVV
jgi:hypothetical protein